MRLAGALICLMLFLAPHVFAGGAPLTSERPKPRVARPATGAETASVWVNYQYEFRPRPRVAFTNATRLAVAPGNQTTVPVASYALASTVPVYRSIRPRGRPMNLHSKSAAAIGQTRTVKTPGTSVSLRAISGTGSICGDRRIIGQRIPRIVGTLPGCGVLQPVRVSSIDGVVLSHPSVMDCATAKALTTWVVSGLKPAVHRTKGGVKSLRVVSDYSCRTRNSKPGAKISEHGKGRAIDIAAISFNDRSTITVLDGWHRRRDGKFLRRIHAAACGPFGTVLGPDANKYHRDHFHFDTAQYRGGPFCE